MKVTTGIALVALGLACAARAAEFELMSAGVPKCAVVVKKGVEAPVAFGAAEFARYLGKVSGGAEPKVGERPVAKLYNVFVGEVSDAALAVAAGVTAEELKFTDDYLYNDSYAVVAKKEGLYIIGANDRGALFGCYDVLKRVTGVRWLFPGADGEYFSNRPTIVVPEMRLVEKPAMYMRKTSAYGDEVLLWQARNRMQNGARKGQLEYDPNRPELKARADFLRGVGCRGSNIGGHVMSTLMFGENWGRSREERLATAQALFKVHPEWFPLLNGKRFVGSSSHESSPNPCLSNPELLDHMASNLIRQIGGKYGAQSHAILGNNDTTIWCECEKCRALDAPEAKFTKGERADRYWWVVNELARRVWKVLPDAHICGWCYQDFWYPPRHVKPDKRLAVYISFNNQCWRHSVSDPKCAVNAEMRRIYEGWKKLDMPIVYNRDEISCEASPGSDMLPCESVLRDSIRSYASIGCSGSSFVIHPPFPEYMAWSKNYSKFGGRSWWWHAMWQTCYLSAELMWNPDADYDALYEEINSLYYGKGWEGGLRDFRKLLEKAFFSVDTCLGWGQGMPYGNCLDLPGSEERLTALLDQALAAAATDPDPRAKAHVARVKEIFECTWLAERKLYLESYHEANVYSCTGEIKLDGVLDEKDWQDAEPITRFVVPPWETNRRGTNVIGRTLARVCYTPETLYIATECYDPEMSKLVARDTEDRRGGYNNLGERVEIFYSHPDMAQRAYQLIVNMKGHMLDAYRESVGSFDTSFMTESKWAVKTYPDHWTLELAVPTRETGMKCQTGSTWRLNVGRCRVTPSGKDGTTKTQTTTCANGHMYSPSNFYYLRLKGEKK